MADARVIPIGVDRPRRLSGTGRDAVAKGAARASGERARRQRRTTPLLISDEDGQLTGTGKVAATERDGAPSRERDQPGRATDAQGSDAQGVEERLDEEMLTALHREAEQTGERIVDDVAAGGNPGDVEERIAAALAFLRRRLTGDYEIDEFGFDAELTDTVLMAVLRPLYRRWFRVEVRGIENLPDVGGALVVANHSGTVAVDALMTQLAVHDEHPQRRNLRLLGADLVFQLPVVGDLARKTGSTLAANPDAERLLASGHVVGVWPEGFKGIGKPFSERYKLQRFGRGGFVSAALRTGSPIVPCAIVGAEEIYPMLGNVRTVARLLGLPYAPITPTWPWLGPLGLVPLPSKWLIEFGTPIRTDDLGPGAADDPMLVFELTDQVRETIQQTLYSLLMQRRSIFF